MEKNLIRLPDPRVPIYRIFPVSRFRQLMQDRQLVLVKPSMWDDPFENFIMQAKSKLQTNEVVSLEALRDKMYGQCWMMCEESDAMWRIYSFPRRPGQVPTKWLHRQVHGLNTWLNGDPIRQGEEGVKVKTTVSKLFNFFYKSHEATAPLCYFLGKVQYYSAEQIEDLIKDANAITNIVLDATAVGNAETLLIKRDAFSHESEVRLIYRADKKYDLTEKLYRFDIDPNALLDEVILDPRLAPQEYDARRQEIQTWGFQNSIRQSSLYLPPRYSIVLQA